MVDNSTQSGADTIRDKDRAGVKTQIVGLDTGIGTGTESLMSTTNPAPVGNTVQASGTLSASDAVVAAPIGDGTLVSGTSTAGSVVALSVPAGMSSWTLLLKGYVSGFIYSEASTNSTNGTDGDWVEVKGRRTGTAPGTETITYAHTANGYYRGNDGGFTWVRARLIGGTGATVQLTASTGTGAVFLNSSLPGGTSTIGGVHGGVLISTTGAIAAAATGTVGPLNVGTAGNVTFTVKNTVAASAWAGAPVVVFEQSDDNASWGPLVTVRSDNQVAASTHVLPAGTANGALMFDAPAESVTYVRARVTTGPTTNGITIDIGAGGMPFSPVVTSVTSPITSLPMGSTTGATPALTGQVGRVVRATANVAQATAATLIAAPAAGTRLYITGITCANEGATLTVVRLFAGSLPAAAGAVAVINDCFDFPIAASGGGAALNFPPNAPWGLPLATALSFAVTVATTWDITVSYYVAA